MAADPYAAIAHDPYASIAAPAAPPAPLPASHTVRSPYAGTVQRPMFNTSGIEDAMDTVGEAMGHTGLSALDLMGRVGQAGVAGIARGPQAAGQALMHGGAPTQDKDMATYRSKIPGLAAIYNQPSKPGKEWIGNLGRGLIDAGLMSAADLTTLLGGSGIIENLANKAGRTGYIAAARAMQGANPVARTAAGIHDFVTPGGAEMGQLKRTLAATQGRPGLDTYVHARSIAKGAANAGTDPIAALNEALGTPTQYIPKPPAAVKKPRFTAAEVAAANRHKTAPEVFGPATMPVNSPLVNPASKGVIGGVDETTGEFVPRTMHQVDSIPANAPARIRNWPGARDVTAPPVAGGAPVWEHAGAFKPQQGFTGGGRTGEVARGISKGAKGLTRGATDLMFVTPQLPGMEGHGSNILQTALLSDPTAALGALGRFAGSGEAVPFSGLRNAVQKLPGVRGLKTAQDASIGRATASGANTIHPEDFGQQGNWLEKIPGVGMAARESNRTLQGWDAAVKGALNDKWTRTFEKEGYAPKVAAAKAADRVAQDVVDYSDKSDWNRALSHVFPFATYATKKPGIVGRAAVRHPERVLALTRNNPNYDPDRDEAPSDPDAGRPLMSIYNALNNKSAGAVAGGPFPGSQYLRASMGAPARDLAGVLNPYFTYGPPGKHAEGNVPLGILKLLLSQTVGNVTGGDQALNATGLNYFGDK